MPETRVIMELISPPTPALASGPGKPALEIVECFGVETRLSSFHEYLLLHSAAQQTPIFLLDHAVALAHPTLYPASIQDRNVPV
jgi:hypothetical protein